MQAWQISHFPSTQESLRKSWKSTRIWKGSLKGFGSVRKPSAHFEWSQPTWGNGYRCWTRGQGTRVRLQKLFPFGTASLRTQTYFRSSLLSTHFGEEKRRPEIRLCPQAREQQGSLEEYRTWDKSQQQKSRNISRYIIKSRNITLIIFFSSGTIPLQ